MSLLLSSGIATFPIPSPAIALNRKIEPLRDHVAVRNEKNTAKTLRSFVYCGGCGIPNSRCVIFT